LSRDPSGQDTEVVDLDFWYNPSYIERPEYTLDFLPELPGLPKFRQAFNSKVIAKLDETEILFISFDDLLKNKQALNRPKDQEDIRQLQLKKSGKKEG
jgi:hypothetical protein